MAWLRPPEPVSQPSSSLWLFPVKPVIREELGGTDSQNFFRYADLNEAASRQTLSRAGCQRFGWRDKVGS